MPTKTKTNSRPHANPTLCEEYRAGIRRCEIIEYLGEAGTSLQYREIIAAPLQQHHIAHANNQRIDLLSNIIMVSGALHPTWIHANEREATIVCLYAKLRKKELELWEINTAFGAVVPDAQPVIATLEEWVITCKPWAYPMCAEVWAYLRRQVRP